MLPTFDVHFAHGHIRVYGYGTNDSVFHIFSPFCSVISWVWYTLNWSRYLKNYITMYKLLVFDHTTCKHTTVCDLFVLDRNTWYHISLWKQIIILLIGEFFTAALADDFLLETAWQQASSSLQDSPLYSAVVWILLSSSYLQALHYLYQSIDDCIECTNYNWYHRHFHVP